jgi:hypothetical protein
MLAAMGYFAFAPQPTSLGEFTIGAADIDARAQGVAIVGRGGAIRGFQVLSGSGTLYYTDDRTGQANIPLTGLSSTSGSVEPQDGPMAIRTINGTSNASPSAALTIRAVW